MSKAALSVLYVRLPVWKIWPGGVVYLADFIHKERPHLRQEILDLALVPAARRRAVLSERLQAAKPDVVAFSWRNMQTFGPHPENDALDVVMSFDHSPSPWKRLKAAWEAVGIIWDYATARLRNFAWLRLARRLAPGARLVVGGTAVSIFGKYIAEKCPPDTVVVVGEGEEAMLSIVDGFERPAGHHYYKDAAGRVSHHPAEESFDLRRLTAADFPYIESVFPGFREYLDGAIGVHTKRGCPFQCHFCLYNKIEGGRQRFRDPVEVAKEIATLNHVYGVKSIWFTDAQFCSTRRSIKHVEAILDEMLARRTDVRWTGYLRLNFLTPEIAGKMLRSGLASIDLSFTGTQDIIDSLTLGYDLEQQMAAFHLFKEAAAHSEGGWAGQKVKLYMPLNAPGETPDTLRATAARIRELYALFGRDNVLPFIFFIGVQPNTPIESKLIEAGYLKRGYNPLTLNPFTIKKLLYNPQPLGRLIGRSYLEALERSSKLDDTGGEYVGRLTMEIIEGKLDRLEQNRSRAPLRRSVPLRHPYTGT
ncbi:MAG: radical SAM protein [Rhodocyclales bacterium]|nr:radical SAM protein [Rhodocyclales bacterium]